jgi:hypothetical protein
MGDQPDATSIPTHRTTQINTHTFMPLVGCEGTTPVFEPVKTVHD